ncbi:MAG: diacylglycerol kinase family protein [Planctomycetaceae bacterium]
MQRRTLLDSLRDAFAGIGYVYRTQRNLRIHAAVTVAVIAFGFWLRLNARDWAVIALTIGAVLAAEIINTVVEALVDLLMPEWHERAKVAKDASAGAVLVISITAVLVGLCVLGPPLWQKLFSVHE